MPHITDQRKTEVRALNNNNYPLIIEQSTAHLTTDSAMRKRLLFTFTSTQRAHIVHTQMLIVRIVKKNFHFNRRTTRYYSGHRFAFIISFIVHWRLALNVHLHEMVLRVADTHQQPHPLAYPSPPRRISGVAHINCFNRRMVMLPES